MRSPLLEAKEDDMRPGKDRLDLLPSGLQRCAARPLFRDEDCNIAQEVSPQSTQNVHKAAAASVPLQNSDQPDTPRYVRSPPLEISTLRMACEQEGVSQDLISAVSCGNSIASDGPFAVTAHCGFPPAPAAGG